METTRFFFKNIKTRRITIKAAWFGLKRSTELAQEAGIFAVASVTTTFLAVFLGFGVVQVALAVVEDAQPLRDPRILLKLRLRYEGRAAVFGALAALGRAE